MKGRLVLMGIAVTILFVVLAIGTGSAQKGKTIKLIAPPMYDWKLDWTIKEALTTNLRKGLREDATEWQWWYSTAQFLLTHPNVEIDFEKSPGWGGNPGWGQLGQPERLMTALASGDAPCMYFPESLGGISTAINEGYAADITDIVKDWKLYQWMRNEMWAYWAPFWQNNRCYGIPGYGYYTPCVIYRKDVFKNAGLAFPQDWTVDEFIQICGKIARPEKQMWALSLAGADQWVMEYLFDIYGLPLVIPDKTGKYTWRSAIDIPEARPIFEFYRTLAFEQKSVLISTGAEPLGQGMDLPGGKLAMALWGTSSSAIWRAAMSSGYFAGPSFYHITGTPAKTAFYEACGIAPFPRGPQNVRTNCGGTIYNFVFNPTLDKDELKAAFDWATWIMGGDGFRIMLEAQRIYARREEPSWNVPSTYPLPEKCLYLDRIVPEWYKIQKKMDIEPRLPSPEEYGLPLVGHSNALVPLIEELITNPRVNLEDIGRKHADRINKGVLNYRAKTQKRDSYEKYYNALDEFYKKHFPNYYAKTFKNLYSKYYKVR